MATTMLALPTPCPMWYFRSDSNIIRDDKATSLRTIFSYFQNWKTIVDEAKTDSLVITCFICGNVASFSNSMTGSYPLCTNCLD